MSEAPKFMVHAPQAAPFIDEATAQRVMPDEMLQQVVDGTLPFDETHTHAEGSATIKAGENTVGVTHGLPGTPHITLHFTADLPPDNFSYVILAGKVFQVNLSAPVKEDTTFTWSADT